MYKRTCVNLNVPTSSSPSSVSQSSSLSTSSSPSRLSTLSSLSKSNTDSSSSPLTFPTSSQQQKQRSKTILSVLPNDNQFYDGYEEFIRNLQEDLENDSFDIYDNDEIVLEEAGAGAGAGARAENEGQQQQRIMDVQEQLRVDQYDTQDEQDGKLKRTTTRTASNNWKPKAFVSSTSNSSSSSKGNYNYTKRRLPKYKRDINDDTSQPIDEEVISKLIIERSKAQSDKNYKKADSILYELNNVYGVYVWDRDRLWSVSSIAPSRRYNPNQIFNGSGQQQHGQQRRGQREYYENQYVLDNNNQFGRNGHDYIQIGNGLDEEKCSLELHEIHSLLAKRLEYKLVRQFAKADEIQSQLYDNGIRVHDKLKQWRGDGGIFADIEGMLSNKEYTMNEYSDSIEDESVVDDIVKIVNQWDQMKKKNNYNEADQIRTLLWDKYNVAVDDKSRTWSAGGDFGPNGTFRWTDDGPQNPRRNKENNLKDWRKVGMYTQSKFSEPLDNPTIDVQQEVWNLIHDRLEARRVKDYDVADLIKDHLYSEYRISVDDQLRQWSVGGIFEEAQTDMLRSASPTTADGKLKSSFVRVYNLRGGTGKLTTKEVVLVEAMIKRRSEEMARYNHQAANSIRNGLRKKFYVVIDDVNGEWHVRGNDFCMSPKIKSIPVSIKSSIKEIEALIRERSQAKEERDFARADEIRSDLFQTFGITLDDRLKEWNIGQSNESNVTTNDGNDKSEEEEEHDEREMEQTLSSMTVPMLKEKLKAAGLPVSGKKSELIDRLLNKA